MDIISVPVITSVFKVITGVFKFAYAIGRFKKQVIDESDFEDQFERAFSKVNTHLLRLKSSTKTNTLDKKALNDSIKRNIKRDKEFLLFYKGEIEEKLFDLILPEKPLRFNSFIKYSFFFFEGYYLFTKKYLFIEKVISFSPWHKTVLHYISIPGWTNLSESELIKKVSSIQKVSPRYNERYNIPVAESVDKKYPSIGNAIEKVLSSGTISTEAALNLMASEKILFVHKYAEDFSDVYKPQKVHSDELNSNLKKIREDLKKSKKEEKKQLLRQQINSIQEELDILHKNWATAPIGTILESYGFQRLFTNMDGVYGIPLSLLPTSDRNNLQHFFSSNIEKPAKTYLRQLIKTNPFAKNHPGNLKYIALFHVVTIDQISIFHKERDLSISPLLSRSIFKMYLTNPKNKIANLYLNDLVRNVDLKFFINQDSKSGAFVLENIDILKKIIYKEHGLDISAPANIIKIQQKEQFDDIAKLLISETSSTIQYWHVSKVLIDLKEEYYKLESEFMKIKV